MNLKYKKMLKGMEKKEKANPSLEVDWLLYMLECSDGSFYTGITNNLDRRFKMHNSGTASRFTRTRLPVKLIYQESCGSRTKALIRECAVKGLPRKKKEELAGV